MATQVNKEPDHTGAIVWDFIVEARMSWSSRFASDPAN